MIKIEASFDDGSIYDLKVSQLLDNYGLTATFYIPSQWRYYLATKEIPPLSLTNIINMSKRHEIGSHGVFHKLLTRVDMDQVKSEVYDSKKHWAENGINTTKFCYPRGYYTEDIKQIVKEAGYESARTVKVGELQPPKDPFETHTTVHVGLDRKEYGSDWLSYAKEKLREAVKRAENEEVVFHYWGHGAEINKLGQWVRFEELLQEVSKI